jgi:hypothetical protein
VGKSNTIRIKDGDKISMAVIERLERKNGKEEIFHEHRIMFAFRDSH